MGTSEVTFIPMVASVSLVTYLSFRNIFLAGRVRDLCKDVSNTASSNWKASLIQQLFYFTKRYKNNNRALLFALTSVSFFGIMTGSVAIFSQEWIMDFHLLPSLSLALGGLFATLAIVITLYETNCARRSLFLHISTTISEMNFNETDSGLSVSLTRLGKIIRMNTR